ncbi:unnamed protein product [Acanthoscelides obtectus]|uniref:CUE domain-containing protein n=1 Tax=Acanthoscelides obtectus TaxID=200917 RepID=A0A9P0P5L7_ACAOB|nr:unnamed protein product [Acanthoscelides obtectus]CAK1634165.1 Activating signal cointegrator 1 complex subunit 2 [Acanthoscelides obtectus]
MMESNGNSVIDPDDEGIKYTYVNVFKNPNKLPINIIHLEKRYLELRKDLPSDLDGTNLPKCQKFYDRKAIILPALDKRWLPKCILYKFEPYIFTLSKEENSSFISDNTLFIGALEYLLNCNFHQFWCTILFEPTAVVSLRSFLLNPVLPHQSKYLKGEFSDINKTIFSLFLLVYERLTTFKVSETEFMTPDFGLKKLLELKLINLPIVTTLGALYKKINLDFVNKVMLLYFDDTSQLDFQFKEVEQTINQTLIALDTINGHLCGFQKDALIVPISLKPRPAVFNLEWVYSVVNYLLNTMYFLNVMLEFYKPSIEMCLEKDLPFRLPSTYVSIYRELYEMLDDRDEVLIHPELSGMIFDEINLGRAQFVDTYHFFVTHCLDKALEYMNDDRMQNQIVEMYLKLMNTALDDEHFICDYDVEYNIASQNEMFESCTSVDRTRTQFILDCLLKYRRYKTLQKISSLKPDTIEDVFKKFKPPEIVKEEVSPQVVGAKQSVISEKKKEQDVESMIKEIMEMFPHLGDGFVLACLEAYDYNVAEVTNAILEQSLQVQLYDIPFDKIRIPPDPVANKPMMAHTGKKPEYDDALKLLNDKKDMERIKIWVLDGIQYSNDYIYDDEYDDRDFDHVPMKVADNPIDEGEPSLPTFNPNRGELASDTSYSSDEEYDDQGKHVDNKAAPKDNSSKLNFCEDPAVIRERREQRYRSKHPPKNPQQKANVVGKPKGHGQDKNVQKARDKKETQKSSKANHNRKSGASWKRSRGMIPS